MKESEKLIEKAEGAIEDLKQAIDIERSALIDDHEQEVGELENKLSETIQLKNLDQELSHPILKRFANQLTLDQIEMLQQFAVDYFPGFNPHI